MVSILTPPIANHHDDEADDHVHEHGNDAGDDHGQ